LFIACSLFIVALGIAAYELVIDKQVAIDFAHNIFVANDHLLQQIIADQAARLNISLAVVIALTGAGLLFAATAYRQMTRPLRQFEDVIKKIRETSNYDLRLDQPGADEIGKLATAFNDMIGEFAGTRAGESRALLNLAQVGRSTTASAASAVIAHEIKQPLAAVAANANAGRRWLMRPVPDIDQAREAFSRIVRDALGASEQIDGLRAVFKKVGCERTPIGMNEVVNEVLSLMQGWLVGHHVLVRLRLQPDLPQVLGDRVQLQQVILNLVMNGAEAMDLVDDRARVLEITSLIQAPHDIEITVRDNGTGVDPGNMSRIFEAFFTTKSGAIGMGLFACHSIIDSHGGRLWASAAEPRGTIFHLRLREIGTAAGQ